MVKSSEIIYHGSYMEIEFSEIRKHRFTKDFSWGFYCTKIKEQLSSIPGTEGIVKVLLH